MEFNYAEYTLLLDVLKIYFDNMEKQRDYLIKNNKNHLLESSVMEMTNKLIQKLSGTLLEIINSGINNKADMLLLPTYQKLVLDTILKNGSLKTKTKEEREDEIKSDWW